MSVRKKFKHWLGETTGLVTSCLKEDIWEAKDAIRNKNGKKMLGREFIVERAGTEPDRLRATTQNICALPCSAVYFWSSVILLVYLLISIIITAVDLLLRGIKFRGRKFPIMIWFLIEDKM